MKQVKDRRQDTQAVHEICQKACPHVPLAQIVQADFQDNYSFSPEKSTVLNHRIEAFWFNATDNSLLQKLMKLKVWFTEFISKSMEEKKSQFQVLWCPFL